MSPPANQSSHTSGDKPGDGAVVRAPQRRTLQSGFSLLARGEPKIWLTGGMLVICLTMIVSLLSLIIINGLATFWPGPVDWLVLSNNELDIGEPQRTEVRRNTSAMTEVNASEPSTSTNTAPNTPSEPVSPPLPSRFYRTANFDITNRHYRWFEPTELAAADIVRPPWALVIERQSWGRMYALASRLALPIRPTSSDQLSALQESETLITELASELETLVATGQPGADPTPGPTPEPNATATPTSEPQPAGDTSLVVKLTEAIARQLRRVRSDGLRSAIAGLAQDKSGSVQLQAEASGPWQAATAQPVQAADDLFAARIVIDDPTQILERSQPVLAELAGMQDSIQHAMHKISLLDGQLSDARVAVRQAELDTGRAVLDKVDGLGPIMESLTLHNRQAARIQAAKARAVGDLNDDGLAKPWQQLLTRYEQEVLAPARLATEMELATWKEQFADEPPAIQSAIDRFANKWQEVLEQKGPLEDQIRQAEASSAGNELSVIVPSDAITLELAKADSDQLLKGQWTEAARAVLAQQSIQPQPDSLHVQSLGDHITLVEFVDTNLGRLTLWCVQRSGTPAVWLMPPQRAVNCSEIVRLFPANRLSTFDKFTVYFARWHEFLLDEPREANTEGGVFPAIWGTVVMTLIMTLAVVPFGVIAALYLREYTRSGPLVSLVRISINNLAGVPSIVYGVFGLAFFCYSIGAFIDGGAKNAQFGSLPSNGWYGLLAGTIGAGVLAFMASLLSSGADQSPSPFPRRLARIAPAIWFASLIGAAVLIFKSPFFEGFYEARLPAPTFGKEGLLWASFTLALLTLPVVIVATEEALSAVPNSLREGSLACGASKWQTIYHIVLPHARPGILTGAILAMARGIGEVAPLMLVGALPVAPDLPLDGEFPYFHGSRSFMHLGYQIYWLGFQSQNSEASKPLVFTCTLLLILIVISLNLSAILLRARLRRRFQGNQF